MVVLRTAGLIEARRPDDKSKPSLPNWAAAAPWRGPDPPARARSNGATSSVLAAGAVASVIPPSSDHIDQSLSIVDGLGLRFERRAA